MAYQALLLRQNTRIIQETIRCFSKEMEYFTWIRPYGPIALMGKQFQLKHFMLLYSFGCKYHFTNIFVLKLVKMPSSHPSSCFFSFPVSQVSLQCGIWLLLFNLQSIFNHSSEFPLLLTYIQIQFFWLKSKMLLFKHMKACQPEAKKERKEKTRE